MVDSCRCVLLFTWCLAAAASWSPIRSPGIVLLGELFPHAKYPPVMFASLGQMTSVVTVENRTGVEYSIDKLNITEAVGYRNGRSHINTLTHEGWLLWLCRNRTELEGSRLVKRTWTLETPIRPARVARARCHNKQLGPFH